MHTHHYIYYLLGAPSQYNKFNHKYWKKINDSLTSDVCIKNKQTKKSRQTTDKLI